MLAASMTPEQLEELSSKIPVRRIATPREQAQPVLFLCSNAASYITGTTLDINGGQF
jgi:NAD(P)-dependent dehydrogenase (short-subunit alcohol dehydrogenase family)